VLLKGLFHRFHDIRRIDSSSVTDRSGRDDHAWSQKKIGGPRPPIFLAI
jgi:hypothetical protein